MKKQSCVKDQIEITREMSWITCDINEKHRSLTWKLRSKTWNHRSAIRNDLTTYRTWIADQNTSLLYEIADC
jgi:hypothetical protein